jgi:hypothetical protein
MPKQDTDAVVVFTEESKQSILDVGCSGDWVLDPKNAGRHEYLVCCRRPSWKNRTEGTAPRSAFLVGRIAGLAKIEGSQDENKRNQARYRINISEYAEVDVANAWRKDLRNPVLYDTLKNFRIDARKLKFKPVALLPPAAGPGDGRMTISEAKKALAASFGVKPEDVEIIIRG